MFLFVLECLHTVLWDIIAFGCPLLLAESLNTLFLFFAFCRQYSLIVNITHVSSCDRGLIDGLIDSFITL